MDYIKNGKKKIVSLQMWTRNACGCITRHAEIRVTTRQEFYDAMMAGVGKNSRLTWSAFETIEEAQKYVEDLKKDGIDFSDVVTIYPEDPGFRISWEK